ncbi:flagellar hook-length control protein FliK [Vibrio zhanjiangensis]|uniref:Flagellar hook-length control protein FliK n=1 Tax=Vibrio zhanjiangensis TaxID=1046128 RepID=A0ABQ6ET87_9VIBR|nr:flagellar hook-length control protein FliK [Vibrio zhanjiangensis]GLT16373.1 flagellar hook-length control protein FliK [Vibrio zhanjiangensis]
MQTPSLSAPQASATSGGQTREQKVNPNHESAAANGSFSLKTTKIGSEQVAEKVASTEAANTVAALPSTPEPDQALLQTGQGFGTDHKPMNPKNAFYGDPDLGKEPKLLPFVSPNQPTNTAQIPSNSASHVLSELTASSKMSLTHAVPIESAASVTTLLQSGAVTNSQIQAQTLPNTGVENTAPTAQWAAIKVDTNAAKWGEQMMQVLHDRVSVQAQQNLQQAQIRLDPPELGKMDLLVRVEGDRLSVQIHANATATREALMQVSDRLRAELQNHNFLHVDVNVGSGDTPRGQSNRSDEPPAMIVDNDQHRDHTVNLDPSEHWLSTLA